MLSGSLLCGQHKPTHFYFLGLAGNLYCLPIPSAAVADPVFLLPCNFALAKKQPTKKTQNPKSLLQLH